MRRFADRTRAEPKFMFAPASPSEQLWESLQADPSFREITDLWARARAVVVGIGEPYQGRAALTSVVPRDEPALVPAVGDINLHFYDIDGHPVSYPGSELLVRPPRELLNALPTSIAMAAGERKAPSILAGARTGLYTTLLTDEPTAQAVLALAVSMG